MFRAEAPAWIQTTPANNFDRFLPVEKVIQIIGFSRNTVYCRIKEGTFPKQVRIGPNSIAWHQSDTSVWVSCYS